MANIPAAVGSGIITGQFLVGTGDTADADSIPDVEPVTGTVTFTPSVPYISVPNASTNPQTILLDTIFGVIDSSGYLCRNYVDPDTGLYVRGVPLIATSIPDVTPDGWVWNVTYNFQFRGKGISGPSQHNIQFAPGNTKDLTLSVPVTSSTGTITIQGPRGLPGPANLVVGPTNTLTMPGLWVQTNFGSPDDFTIWIEDGL